MYGLLLAIIYTAFISLGLPDSLIGSAWPVMHGELNAPLSSAGIISMIIAGGTVVSSISSDFLTKKLGAGLVTALSVLSTALAIFGFSVAQQFWHLCLLAIPYGLGAGATDAALNNYVALHYSSRHMNWLHSFWGLGAMISPYIMGACLTGTLGWKGGYRIVSIIQFALTAVLFLSLPMWKKREHVSEKLKPLSPLQTLRLKHVPIVLIAFFCYCGVEQTAILWGSSYLVQAREIAAETAAFFASLFFIGITAGRMLCGFISEKTGDKLLIRIGAIVMLTGAVLIAIPFAGTALAGLVLFGLGCAPVYPAIIHSTPFHFGKDHSQSVIGIEMASAYIGTTFLPPLFGLIAQYVSVSLFPFFLLLFTLLMLGMTELLNRKSRTQTTE